MLATCPFCPLRCDDLVVRAEGTHLVPHEVDCPRAHAGFAGVAAESARLSSLAAWRTASVLAESIADRVAGAASLRISGTIIDITTARAAVRLAAACGGVVDAAESVSSAAMRRAIEREGVVAATLAELSQRADSVVLLGDPSDECPRLVERFLAPSPAPPARVGERARRRFLSLGESRIAGLPGERYTHIEVARGDLHRLLAEARGALRVGKTDSSGIATWLADATYSGWLWSSEALDPLAAGTLVGLSTELNRERRAVLVSLASDTTLRSVSTWLSGFSGPVDFGSGAPQLLENSTPAELTLWLQPYPTAPPPPLEDTFLIVLGMADAELAERADVYLPAGVPGVDFASSTYRGDAAVCLPLHALLDRGLPSAAEVLGELQLRRTDRC
ncbi:molybdopterin-binding domain-containing protein [Candidatus Laterigemmans baculatus]|uniref:hypothetical protein n=1 Tax=Candidatus Laterigemmans baculatus TaxID=2770505 RepID=UPI0013DC55C1|nr:hypothetical protein [Candidatus Laterigemmans baculatus]